MGIFDKGLYIEPKYNFLEKYVNMAYKGFWTPAKYEKLIKEVDAPQFFNSMDFAEQETIRRCILAIATVEDKVKNFWNGLFHEIPQTIVSDIGAMFAQMETTHRRSYHSLAENLNVDTSDLERYPILRDRIAYLTKHIEKDPKIIGKKRVLKTLTLFTALVEKGSLFSQFYILMSFEKNSKGLTTISSLQQSTASEETMHYNFGIDLINIIKEEYPQLWEEYLIDLVTKNLEMAYETELKLIDWFFENGVPNHLTKNEVVNFLNFNFNTIAKDLKLDRQFDYDTHLYLEKNEWFMIKLKSTEPDFFNSPAGGYSSEKEEINLDKFEF